MAIGRLDFYIPGDSGAKTLVFEQNINVSESKEANYAKYDILARSSTIYAYLGAKSRVIKLSFDVLLEHLAAFPDSKGYDFKTIGTESDFGPPDSPPPKEDTAQSAPYTGLGSIIPFGPRDDGGGDAAAGGGGADAAYISEPKDFELLQEWIDTIRKCVSNDSDDPTTGPPTIVFSYTEAYQNISCICKDYKINLKAQDKAGMQGTRDSGSESLRPRLVNFSLTLEEIV